MGVIDRALKFRQQNNITINGVRQGFNLRDSLLVRKESDHTPKIQTFTFEDENQEPEERTYWCAECKGQLTYLEKTDTIWKCENCLSYYDTKIQDTPIKDKSEFKLIPHSDTSHYATLDQDDPNLPFIQGIDLEQQNQEEVEVIRSSNDKRVQHLRVIGSPANAISAMNNYEKGQKQRR